MTRDEVAAHLREITGGRMPEREAWLHATAMEMSLAAVSAKLTDNAEQRGDAAKLMQDLCFAALAYARPIVAEECARIVESLMGKSLPVSGVMSETEIVVREAAAAIREHGRKP